MSVFKSGYGKMLLTSSRGLRTCTKRCELRVAVPESSMDASSCLTAPLYIQLLANALRKAADDASTWDPTHIYETWRKIQAPDFDLA